MSRIDHMGSGYVSRTSHRACLLTCLTVLMHWVKALSILSILSNPCQRTDPVCHAQTRKKESDPFIAGPLPSFLTRDDLGLRYWSNDLSPASLFINPRSRLHNFTRVTPCTTTPLCLHVVPSQSHDALSHRKASFTSGKKLSVVGLRLLYWPEVKSISSHIRTLLSSSNNSNPLTIRLNSNQTDPSETILSFTNRSFIPKAFNRSTSDSTCPDRTS